MYFIQPVSHSAALLGWGISAVHRKNTHPCGFLIRDLFVEEGRKKKEKGRRKERGKEIEEGKKQGKAKCNDRYR
jgi:hypothetical protein